MEAVDDCGAAGFFHSHGPDRPVSRVLYPSGVYEGRQRPSLARRDGDHLSRSGVAAGLEQPTRGQAGRLESPYSALLQVGFSRPSCRHERPGRSYRPFSPLPAPRISEVKAVWFLRYFPYPRRWRSSPRVLGVTQHLARWSPDFPLPRGPYAVDAPSLAGQRSPRSPWPVGKC